MDCNTNKPPSRAMLEAKIAWLETQLAEAEAVGAHLAERLGAALDYNLRLRDSNRGLMRGLARAQRRAALERALREGETS